ncbi:MAG: alkaline phosphatase family protein [Clostridiales bacterium]|nr:alkaline phosphatase family protein [Clostridiales bacterium]
MKIIILGDGMADIPRGGAADPQTPLCEAKTPVIDSLIGRSFAGLVKTVPDGMKPGSDVANLSVMGYDPKRYYTGRSPLEAVSIGIAMKDDDLALRCNLVTLGNAEKKSADAQENGGINANAERRNGANKNANANSTLQRGINANAQNRRIQSQDPQAGSDCFGEKIMLDYSAGEIGTGEAHILIADFEKHLKALSDSQKRGTVPQKTAETPKTIQNITDIIEKSDESGGIDPSGKPALAVGCFTFYGGVSYRNCLIIENGKTGTVCTPPHDISGKKIGGYLPRGVYGETFREIIEESHKFLTAHEINKKRIERGQNPANAVWLWGEGKKPMIDDFYKLNGKKGAVISAVDLIKGIGMAANMKIYEVEGATGTVETNFLGKAEAALSAVSDGCDFVYLHIEAADECGHHGDREGKIRSIEKIDGVIGYIKDGLDKKNLEYSLMILPDHPTPLSTMTHSVDPVPFMIFDGQKNLSNGVSEYNEMAVKKGGFFESGESLLKFFIEN